MLLPLAKVHTSIDEKGKLSLAMPRRRIRRVDIYLYSFLYCLLGGEVSESRICRFTQREITPVPFEQNAGWALDSVSIVWGKNEKYFVPDAHWNPDRSARAPVTIPATLSRLPSSHKHH